MAYVTMDLASTSKYILCNCQTELRGMAKFKDDSDITDK
jgi:hypothetical protein